LNGQRSCRCITGIEAPVDQDFHGDSQEIECLDDGTERKSDHERTSGATFSTFLQSSQPHPLHFDFSQ
jgi:hypothetical protein